FVHSPVPLPPASPLFPYTTLFRSARLAGGDDQQVGGMPVDDVAQLAVQLEAVGAGLPGGGHRAAVPLPAVVRRLRAGPGQGRGQDRKSTRLNSSHVKISYAVFCLK